MQQGKKADKWSSRANVSVYLGPSLQHANNVCLILSLSTGLTSPQFHVKYDSEFATVRGKNNEERLYSDWQDKCKFRMTQQVRTASRTWGLTVKWRKLTPTDETTESEPATEDPFTDAPNDVTIQGSTEPEGDDDGSGIVNIQQTEHEVTEATNGCNGKQPPTINQDSKPLLAPTGTP